MAESPKLHVTLVYSAAPRQVREWELALVDGATVLQALQASGLAQEFPALALTTMAVGVWGGKAALKQVLREGDRVEVYRPLRVDPKVARRERFRNQGARATGLFANKRPGSKAGY